VGAWRPGERRRHSNESREPRRTKGPATSKVAPTGDVGATTTDVEHRSSGVQHGSSNHRSGGGRAGGEQTRRRLNEGAASTGHAELRHGEDQRRLRRGTVDPTPMTEGGRGRAGDIDAARWPRRSHGAR
jgi:hypothetical protein